jgi:hypothetical protein
MWPDFDGASLAAAVAEFHRRERRFGGVLDDLPPAALEEIRAIDEPVEEAPEAAHAVALVAGLAPDEPVRWLE